MCPCPPKWPPCQSISIDSCTRVRVSFSLNWLTFTDTCTPKLTWSCRYLIFDNHLYLTVTDPWLHVYIALDWLLNHCPNDHIHCSCTSAGTCKPSYCISIPVGWHCNQSCTCSWGRCNVNTDWPHAGESLSLHYYTTEQDHHWFVHLCTCLHCLPTRRRTYGVQHCYLIYSWGYLSIGSVHKTTVSLVPRPHLKKGKGLGTSEHILGSAPQQSWFQVNQSDRSFSQVIWPL